MAKTLDLKWDKKEQKFSERTCRKQVARDKKRDVEEYLDFLTEVEPKQPDSVREKPFGRYFAL